MDYRNPDYPAIFERRMKALQRLRKDPKVLPAARLHYKHNPIDFIADWGVTSDPRNLDRALPVTIPLVPFPKQEEWLQWLLDRWKGGEDGLTEKSRDMGCSVNFMALLSTLALFNDGFVGGVGSRKEDLVDRVGDPDTLFYKARMFLSHLPVEFRGGWNETNKTLSSHMKIDIPNTGSVIKGEAGVNIGRGGRASIYGVDESAFLTNQASVDGALSQNTRCRIDLSTVNGMDNKFAEKRFGGKVAVFIFDWKDDPRKDQDWYNREVGRLNPLIVAQEIDRDYKASKEGILIPSAWVQAAIDAHVKLGIMPTGLRKGALDVADEGRDKNSFAGKYGFMLEHLEEWSGVGSDIFKTSERACGICDVKGYREFDFDSDGLGVGVRGDMNVINGRENRKNNQIAANPYRGSGSVVNPKAEIIPSMRLEDGTVLPGRTNEDFFANRKAQSWWHVRTLFQNTYRAVVEGMDYNPDEIISIPKSIPLRDKLESELSQPTYSINTAGKLIVDKAPDGMASPNNADSVVIAYAPAERKKSSIFD